MADEATTKAEITSVPRLKTQYEETIRPKLQEEFSYANVMEIPKVEKVVLNIGLGEATTNPKLLEKAMVELGQITGQKPVMRRAKKSVSNFKLREGQPIGCSVAEPPDRVDHAARTASRVAKATAAALQAV